MTKSKPLVVPLIFALGISTQAQDANVLLIIADDLGINHHGLYNDSPGADLPPTPNIDALRSTGVQFRNAYAQPTCSPTRASILTGRYGFRTGVTTAVTANDGQLTAGEFTLPRAFAAQRSDNYGLAHFGKWHLSIGPNMANDPENLGGWPHFSGSLNGGLVGGNGGSGTYNAWTKTINGVTGVPNSTTTYATTDTTNDAISWIGEQGDHSWFAWVAYNAPHTPFHKPPANLHTYDTTVPGWNTLPIGANQKTHFNAAVEALDTEIGRLLASIDPAVLARTWVIFIGDNGSPPQVTQTPFTPEHGKNTLFEGGVRVPLLISGPGVTAPDREVADPVHAVDLYATILEMAGIDVEATQPAIKPIDSRSLMTLLKNEVDVPRVVLGESAGATLEDGESGITTRSGNVKLIRFNDNTEGLFDLTVDPDEQNNLLLGTISPEVQTRYESMVASLEGSFAPVNLQNAPVETAWQMVEGSEYARIFRTQNRALNGITDTTWAPEGPVRNGRQELPVYAGIESIRVSANWVYVKGSSLPHYNMGPWYFDAAKTQLFVNYPNKWDMLTRLPRRPQPAITRTNTNFGPIAVWVNNAIIHNQLDAFYWDGSADVDDGAVGTEYWTRNARLAEGPTFDPAGSHQPFTGESHHHISPHALRYELGDHMDYDPQTHTYTESTNAPAHSPILGWSFDGYPIYGPFGYGDADDPESGIRRMVSGFVPRDGSFGTTNLTSEGRTSLPQWALRSGHGISPVDDAANGPAISVDFPMGWYLQDYDYLGDLGYAQGVDFDLDDSNGRWGVTPEFPEGSYAYFVTLDENFEPAYPYIIGRQYYGVKQGGNWAARSTVGFNTVEEPHTTTYLGGAFAETKLDDLSVENEEVVLLWSGVEGGQYTIESSRDVTDWTTTPPVDATGGQFQTRRLVPPASPERSFHRFILKSVAPHDEIDTP